MLEELGEDGLGELVQLVQDDAGAVGAPGDQVPVLGVAEDVVQLGEEGRHHASRVLARRVRGIRTGSRLAAGGEGGQHLGLQQLLVLRRHAVRLARHAA